MGQTIQPLHVRINGHRSCVKRNVNTFIYQHFNTAGHNFADAKIQIIDCLDPTDSSNLDDIENFWISTLCTMYPLGLNDRIKGIGNISNISNNVKEKSYGYFNSPIRRRNKGHGKKKNVRRSGKDNNVNELPNNPITIIHNEILTLHNLFNTNIYSFYTKLRSLNKKLLKRIIIKVISDNLTFSSILQSYFHNTFGSKTISKVVEREFIIIPFNCKFIDTLSIESIIRDNLVSSFLPALIRTKLPLKVFYRYNPPISRKLLNYSTFLKNLSKDEICNILKQDCSCSSSEYTCNHYKHIITGNLDFISNVKLRNLMSFGTKYREPVAKTPNDIRDTMFEHVDKFIQSKAKKYNINSEHFADWENKVKDIISNRINFFVNNYIDVFSCKPSLFLDKEVINYLKKLHRDFVVVVADKASNNFVFICKKLYITVLMNEMGVDAQTLLCTGNPTYSFVAVSKQDIISNAVKQIKVLFNIVVPKEDFCVPSIFWNPKLHKTPYKARFIAGARRCVTKGLAIKINKGLQVLKASFVRYCRTIYQRTGFNFNWSIDSSLQFLDRIKSLEIWSLQVFDFTTLYTNLDLQDVEKSLFGLCDLLFSSKNKFICINFCKAFFSKKKYNGFHCFDIALLKKAINFILQNTFVSFGGFILKQTKGIPMGGNCSSPTADLYLSFQEFSFMKRLLKEKKFGLAKLLSNNNRYVDDVIILNYKRFGNKSHEIYPGDLLLERNGADDKNVCYLDVEIKVSDVVNTTLFNKTDSFNFPVVMFTFPSGNIPMALGYNIFFGQVLRYAKICSKSQDFIGAAARLFHTLYTRGYSKETLYKRFIKVFRKDNFLLYKFGYIDVSEVCEDFLLHINYL